MRLDLTIWPKFWLTILLATGMVGTACLHAQTPGNIVDGRVANPPDLMALGQLGGKTVSDQLARRTETGQSLYLAKAILDPHSQQQTISLVDRAFPDGSASLHSGVGKVVDKVGSVVGSSVASSLIRDQMRHLPTLMRGTHPVGIIGGVLVGGLAEAAYQNNLFGVRDGIEGLIAQALAELMGIDYLTDELAGKHPEKRLTLDDVLAAAMGQAAAVADERRAGGSQFASTQSSQASSGYRDQSAALTASQRQAQIDMFAQQATQLAMHILQDRMAGGGTPGVGGRASGGGAPPGGGSQVHEISEERIRQRYPDGWAHDIQVYDRAGSGRWQILHGMDSQSAENILANFRATAGEEALRHVGYIRSFRPTSPIRVGADFIASPRPISRR